MKIIIYTTSECEFSKKEKEYLTSHSFPFEEKNLETNREFLTEMLAVSNNFAGTPVTKIEKDDGQIVVLKGFTLEEFDKALETAKPPVQADQAPVSQPNEPMVPNPAPPAPVPQPPVAEPTPTPPPTTPPVVEAPMTNDPRMSSLLNNLQQKADDAPVTEPQQPSPQPQTPPTQPPMPPPPPPAPPQPETTATTGNLPTIPDPNFG